jgi:hypothetical protein
MVSEDSHEEDNNPLFFWITKKRWPGYGVEHCNQASSADNKPGRRAEEDKRPKHRPKWPLRTATTTSTTTLTAATSLALALSRHVVRPPSPSVHNYKVPVNRDTTSRSLVSPLCPPANSASFRYANDDTCTASRFGHTPTGGPSPSIHGEYNHARREA